MFSIEPYRASRYVVNVVDGTTTMSWEPCKVIGVDARRDDPQYLVEIRGKDGSFYLERADLIRKEP